jgi:hypothetical protein
LQNCKSRRERDEGGRRGRREREGGRRKKRREETQWGPAGGGRGNKRETNLDEKNQNTQLQVDGGPRDK